MDVMSVYSNFFMYWNKPENRRLYVRKYNYIMTLLKIFDSYEETLKELIDYYKNIDVDKLEEFNQYWDRFGAVDKDSSENIIDSKHKDITIYWIDVEKYLEEVYNILESIYLYIFYNEMSFDSAPHPKIKKGSL